MVSRNFLPLLTTVLAAVRFSQAGDPCAAIGGQKWVAPSDVRACFSSIPVNATQKANIIEVVNKTLAFHTSVNYQKQAPAPFASDVHENLLQDLARISSRKYPNDFELHKDLSYTLKRLNDGHCVYINYCYDSLFVSYLPTPLTFITDAKGRQSVHIAPEAFSVATAEFSDEISVWQNALPGALKGKLDSLSGAKVIAIDGQDPLKAVDANAAIAGSFQGLGTRQNAFFSSYQSGSSGWVYSLGQFAQMSLPLKDSVKFTIQRVNSTKIETVTLPYRSRFGSSSVSFTDKASFLSGNCLAVDGTNGASYYDTSAATKRDDVDPSALPANKFRQAPMPDPAVERTHAMNVALDVQPQVDVTLPPKLQPTNPLPGSGSVVQFFMLDDGKTGVLALGSFSGDTFSNLMTNLLSGLQNLKSQGATQLVVDVSNNGGGYICIAHWLHRIIVGPKSTSVPQAGLDTKARAGPLARQVTKVLNSGGDPDNLALYSSASWKFANNTAMPVNYDWLEPPVQITVNGVPDAFSQRLGQECQPFDQDPPSEALFDPASVAIVSNGRCASSCSLFSITMSKLEGSKTVVYGGRKGLTQQYCGTVGGQSTDFSTMDSEIKTASLKNSSLAPPDFLTNSVQGITWRLGFGIDNTEQPEEWQNHAADVVLPLTLDIVNNPVAIWKAVAKSVL
ncbi:uncharacterized protein BXZ73DRAFT_105687 [Epithele typhae]|uniref:uncharacterized protein n=1 Tax=Epithele typhae TaxID=378194 RepID=UPI0020089B57|nr:uncharacterized protein BXZ73DRAFT_105687 [Epithele typhae]KAH9916995.1 hypothetical protein BXZ73DRAFT_105687 [Epithele typhae]